ncbi:biotin synthesis protein BioC [Thalassotalea loyana]|uniref:Malonyl-[acyl-carrier protein] O-methyltransferase n=1 Tax=Thalassotalea loyana TaxID=280483 RepID=A0ABQ6HEA0_9GAMM|nr:malonyl-ACP O-methyltransferase BioC [Thalassotalea loyana]GLX86441.1 biotin synthesis protein BioC [Thalassotalea loyana]
MVLKHQQQKIAQNFGSASASYDVSARLQRFSGKHLLPWLPNRHDLTVLDLGCGTGFFSDILATRFETVIGLDLSKDMLAYTSENRNQDIHLVNANAMSLPFLDNSLDVVYSNLVIQWCNPLIDLLNEIKRVLKPGGLFIVSTLVDGTLFELKSAWAQVDDEKHVIDFKTKESLIHDIESVDFDLLEVKQQDIALEYENVRHLAHELKGLGANHVPNKSNKGLAGKDKWRKMTLAYEDFREPSGIYPATYALCSAMLVKLNY